MVGYYFVYLGLRFQSNQELAQRMDSESYTKDETITIEIPFTLPYWSDSDDFQRISGEFEYKGEFYKLVKQELKGDILYVVCIRDTKEKRNFNFMAGFAKLSTDVPVSSKNTLKLFGSLLKDFVSVTNPIIPFKPSTAIITHYGGQQFELIATTYPVLTPPPDSIS